jgi:two-component system, cell cycle sensor histidine kinase and response regulator CckA
MSFRLIEDMLCRAGEYLLGMAGALAALVGGSKSPAATVAVPRFRAPAPAPKEAATVLAVDDDAMYLNVLSDMLRQGGLRVLTSTSPAKGLDMLRYKRDEIDLVLLDYSMPTLDGDIVLQHMRKVCPDLPVVAMTGLQVHELPVSFRENTDDFLTKPFTSEDLIGCIESLLRRGRGDALHSSAA